MSVAVGQGAARTTRIAEHTATRTRPGRRFLPTAELELGPALRDLASRLPGATGGVLVVAEMPGPTGLPDLVAVPVTSRLDARLAVDVPPLLSSADVRLAAACSPLRKSLTPTLARQLETDVESVRRRVRRLERTGALVADGAGWRRHVALVPVGRLYALEAKVDDWNAGLAQALRYGAWADASAVVMGQLPRDPSKPVAQATALGLGLAHGARWLVRPKVRRLSLAKRLFASEHLVAALRSSAL